VKSTTVLGDKIEASMQLPAEIMTQVTGKQVRVLAVSGERRLASLPDVATFREASEIALPVMERSLGRSPSGTAS